ncbi:MULTISPECIES: hypothetical protein [unclassified Paenibacillus]|uniref:hypothetical protein n=1 Tax=unclassified Paenibacillus TaxID=185978 RepID=UPI001C10EB81|nr:MULTISPECIES: hypothetical protein [unclassified Paenibacillus]MBU5441734.1 hypothetical protein [Paenibacillus sp. MSJ-34]CAH0122125.1 hypothetical protein PAE9249_04667 [Paenibacillus sp. CECT 9249]
MGFIVRYNDKDDHFTRKEQRFIIRSSAEEEARKRREEGHADVVVQDESEGSNMIGIIVRIIGIAVIIVGIVIGFVAGQLSYEFQLIVSLYWWCGSFITGMLFIGFAEVIKLLHEINRKIK